MSGLFSPTVNVNDPSATTISPVLMGLLGLAQGAGQYSGASRLPITGGQVLGGAAGGFGRGYMAGLKEIAQAQATQAQVPANLTARMMYNLRAASLGLPPLPMDGTGAQTGKSGIPPLQGGISPSPVTSASLSGAGAPALTAPSANLPRFLTSQMASASQGAPAQPQPPDGDGGQLGVTPASVPQPAPGASGGGPQSGSGAFALPPGLLMQQAWGIPITPTQSSLLASGQYGSPAGQNILRNAASKSAGISPFIGGTEQGVPLQTYDPASNTYAPQPGTFQNMQQGSRAYAAGQFPFKMAENFAYRGSEPVRLGPNDRATTGFNVLGSNPIFKWAMGQVAGPTQNGGPTTGPGNAPGGASVAIPSFGTYVPASAPGASPSAPATVARSAPPQGISPRLWNEIPSRPLAPPPANEGISEGTLKAQEEAAENKQTIDAAGTAAVHTLADLKNLQASLDSGQFNTNMTAPARTALANMLVGFGMDDGTAHALTGINPGQMAFFNKDANRMGLQFARSTEGAREAVQAIKIALGANPSQPTVESANKMMIQVMQRAAQYQVDTQNASDAYFYKNRNMVGFSGWWNKSSPATNWTTGKIDPYELPMANGKLEAGMLMPGFFYRSPTGTVAEWNGKGFIPQASAR